MMNKKGFTLIELMVVVVIIGILAAVAVPKLFGMIAKSKASEVGPAAGTYVKMQQAYISEAMQIGGWNLIGYKAPGDATNGTTNFKYDSALLTGSATITTSTVGWRAANKANLNDCAGNGTTYNWTVTVLGTAGDSDATFTAAVPGANCTELTPTFTSIGG